MRKLYTVLAVTTIAFSSCAQRDTSGIINDKAIVYYKGKGITETEASKLSNFFLEMNKANTTKKEVLQLSKESGVYVVRYVAEKEDYEKHKDLFKSAFSLLGTWVSERVFDGAETKVVLTDSLFNGYLEVAENKKIKEVIHRVDSLSAIKSKG